MLLLLKVEIICANKKHFIWIKYLRKLDIDGTVQLKSDVLLIKKKQKKNSMFMDKKLFHNCPCK